MPGYYDLDYCRELAAAARSMGQEPEPWLVAKIAAYEKYCRDNPTTGEQRAYEAEMKRRYLRLETDTETQRLAKAVARSW